MVANFALQAVPLAAENHRLRLEFLPQEFLLGRLLSIISLAGYLAVVAYWGIRTYRTKYAA